MVDKQGWPQLQQVDGEEPAAARNERATIVWHEGYDSTFDLPVVEVGAADYAFGSNPPYGLRSLIRATLALRAAPRIKSFGIGIKNKVSSRAESSKIPCTDRCPPSFANCKVNHSGSVFKLTHYQYRHGLRNQLLRGSGGLRLRLQSALRATLAQSSSSSSSSSALSAACGVWL